MITADIRSDDNRLCRVTLEFVERHKHEDEYRYFIETIDGGEHLYDEGYIEFPLFDGQETPWEGRDRSPEWMIGRVLAGASMTVVQ